MSNKQQIEMELTKSAGHAARRSKNLCECRLLKMRWVLVRSNSILTLLLNMAQNDEEFVKNPLK
jgi:hypothetical protein